MDQEERVIKLLDGELSTEEKVELEGLIEKNPEINNDKIVYEQIIETIQIRGEENLRSKLNEYMGEYLAKEKVNTKSKQVVKYLFYGGIAASVMLVISFFLWVPASSDPQELYSAYYQPYPSLVTVRSSGDDNIPSAFDDYSKGNYSSALNKFRKEENKSDTNLFYQGLSYLSLNQTDSALVKLMDIPKRSIFSQHAAWYVGLVYLKKGKIEASIERLKHIKPNQYKYEESIELIKALEK